MATKTAKINFRHPPIYEVAYSLQFEPLDDFHLGYAGLLWGEFREDYPNIEIAEQLPHEIERFGAVHRNIPLPKIKFLEGVPEPRLKMVQPSGVSLLQIQKDRFIFNWRKFGDEGIEYPRFPVLKQKFEKELSKFESYIEKNRLGDLEFNQVEITNVNHIPVDGREFSEVFFGLNSGSAKSPELESESFLFQLNQVISHNGAKIGRLYIRIEKAKLVSNGTDIFKLTFTARAHPVSPKRESALDLLNILRSHINNSFIGFTTEEMHSVWGKEETT